MTGIQAEYGTTADGLLAVRIDYLGLVAVPDGDGILIRSVLSALSKPIATWSETDMFGRDGRVPDEAGFRAHVDATLHHFRQREALGRERIADSVDTPWGPSQSATRYAEGIISYDTASHGGFHVDEENNAALHAALRFDDGWYEEDCDWARVAIGYPDLFTDREQEMAERTLRDWSPEAWEDYYGRPLDRSESHLRDREAFEREHVDDWIVIAASLSREQPDHVVATASLGGKRGAIMTKDFLVPDREYARGRHGFMIDPERHKPIE